VTSEAPVRSARKANELRPDVHHRGACGNNVSEDVRPAAGTWAAPVTDFSGIATRG